MKNHTITRKYFIKTSGLSLAATLIGAPALSYNSFMGGINPKAKGKLTIQQVIDLMKGTVEGDPIKNTVDSVKIGNTEIECTGIVSTFLPTAEIIQKTAELGANLIVTHEPTFYNHRDKVDWLEGDPVYEFKRELLVENNIVVFRFHDYWHKHNPDGILHGLLKKLDWENYHKKTERNTGICLIPETPLKDLAGFFKNKLNLQRPSFIGDPNMSCSKVGLLPGSWGPRSQMGMLRDNDVEVLVL